MKVVVFPLLVLLAVDSADAGKNNNRITCENKLKACENENQVLLKKIEDQNKEICKLEAVIYLLRNPHPTEPPTEPIATAAPTAAPPSKNCYELLTEGKTDSGVYFIDPDGQGAFEVYCDQDTDGGGYTVIQNRLNGSVDFYIGWEDYKNGFGNIDGGEFWLGLDKIHRLTSQAKNKLRVNLMDWNGVSKQAEFSGFNVAGEDDKYKMTLESFLGSSAGDSMTFHSGCEFSTKDQDNDKINYSCAQKYSGAWWYNGQGIGCHRSNLNGLYKEGGQHSSYADGIDYYTWKGYNYSAMKESMEIRAT